MNKENGGCFFSSLEVLQLKKLGIEVASDISQSDDSSYFKELLRFAAVPVFYPSVQNQCIGFSPSMENLQSEEKAECLPWESVSWNKVRVVQQVVFPEIVDWYKKQIMEGKIVLPPTAYKQDGAFIVKNGTHRLVAFNEIAFEGKNADLANSDQVTLALSPCPVVNVKLYSLENIQKKSSFS